VLPFITKRPLWVNVLFAIFLLLACFFLFFSSLTCITQHGKILKIPDVIGKNFETAKKTLEGQGFEVILQDSVYVDTVPPLAVLKQFPDADDEVKINRAVYLTLNRASPPLIEMPDLEGKSLRIAVMMLSQYGLKLGDTTFKPDFAKNAVLEQRYKGSIIKAGTKIQMGSVVSFVVGSGLSEEDMMVPDLVGMTYIQARSLLEANGLGSLPIVDKNVRDTLNSYVYKQNPERYTDDKKINRVRQGQMLDIWLSKEQQLPADTTLR
jgi:eukaryotic-like serine/threonine-protein kinase